jgi:hypothetical protein
MALEEQVALETASTPDVLFAAIILATIPNFVEVP